MPTMRHGCGMTRSSRLGCVCLVAQSCPTLCDPMDCSLPAPLPMEFSRQEYWSGLSFPPPGDLPHPGIEPTSLVSPALAGGFFTTTPPGKALLQLHQGFIFFYYSKHLGTWPEKCSEASCHGTETGKKFLESFC